MCCGAIANQSPDLHSCVLLFFFFFSPILFLVVVVVLLLLLIPSLSLYARWVVSQFGLVKIPTIALLWTKKKVGPDQLIRDVLLDKRWTDCVGHHHSYSLRLEEINRVDSFPPRCAFGNDGCRNTTRPSGSPAKSAFQIRPIGGPKTKSHLETLDVLDTRENLYVFPFSFEFDFSPFLLG